ILLTRSSEEFEMNLPRFNSVFFEKSFCRKNHLFRPADEDVVHSPVVDDLREFIKLFLINPSKMDLGVCPLPAEYVYEVESIRIPVLYRLQRFEENDRASCSVAIHKRKLA